MRKPVISATFVAAAAAAVAITATSCLPMPPRLAPTPANARKAPGWHIVCHGAHDQISNPPGSTCHWVRNPK